jgi:hypothetical protein
MPGVEPQPTLLFAGAVTLSAVFEKKRADLTPEVDWFGGRSTALCSAEGN